MVDASSPTRRSGPTTAVALVYASAAVQWVSYALLAVVLPFRFESLGISVFDYGVAMAILAFGMLVTEGVWGALAFRLGNARTIAALGIAVAILYALVGVSTTFLALAISLGLLGAVFIFEVPLMRWIALTALGPGGEGRGTGLYGVISGVGLVVGTALGPIIFVEFGFAALTVVIVASYAVGVGLTVLLPWHEVALPARQPGVTRQVRAIFTRPFVMVAWLVILAFIAKSLVWNFLQYYSVSLFQGTASEAGYVIGAAQAVSLVAGVLLGILVDRWGPGRSTPLGFVLVAVGALATLLSTSYPEMVSSTLLFSAGVGWLSASLLPLALSPVPRSAQGTAVGVFGSFEDFGLLIGPILIGAVYSGYGARNIFLVVGALAFAGAATSLLFYRADRRTYLEPGVVVSAEAIAGDD